VAYLTWMPSFLVEKFGLSLAAAGFSSMVYHHVGAFIGVIIGGSMADRFSRRNRRNRLLVQSLALLCGMPFIYYMGAATTPSGTYAALFAFGVFRGIYDSNIFASLYEVIKPELRSSASGLMLMCAFLAGACSPWLLGVLKPTLGLAAGLSNLWISYLVGSAAIAVAIVFYFSRDAVMVFLEGLQFPEGPAFAPDGSLWAVELHGGKLLRWEDGAVSKVAGYGFAMRPKDPFAGMIR
jgi:sugar phosphate permease